MSEALEDTAILPSSFLRERAKPVPEALEGTALPSNFLRERAKPVPEALEGTILRFLWFFQAKVALFFQTFVLGLHRQKCEG